MGRLGQRPRKQILYNAQLRDKNPDLAQPIGMAGSFHGRTVTGISSGQGLMLR
jgi:hypothetical protein